METELKLRVLAALGLLACLPDRCSEPETHPCLSVIPEPEVTPCLSPPLTPCLSVPEPPVAPCLSIPELPPVAPCLVPPEQPPPPPAPDKQGAHKPIDADEVRERVLASGRLPEDVIERLRRR